MNSSTYKVWGFSFSFCAWENDEDFPSEVKTKQMQMHIHHASFACSLWKEFDDVKAEAFRNMRAWEQHWLEHDWQAETPRKMHKLQKISSALVDSAGEGRII